MVASFVGGFADISLGQLALIAVMALIASVIGGVSGYGTGALMPLILVPIVGPEPVVPMLSLSALLNNASRAAVFRNLIDFRRVAGRAAAGAADDDARRLGLHPAHRPRRRWC